MSETKFSKGPWQRDKYGNVEAINHKGRLDTLRVYGVSLCHPSDESVIANTHLITAAPLLYEALEAVCLAARMEGLSGRPGWSELIATMQDALKAARGEA